MKDRFTLARLFIAVTGAACFIGSIRIGVRFQMESTYTPAGRAIPNLFASAALFFIGVTFLALFAHPTKRAIKLGVGCFCLCVVMALVGFVLEI